MFEKMMQKLSMMTAVPVQFDPARSGKALALFLGKPLWEATTAAS